MTELTEALRRLRQNPDFKLFEEYLITSKKKHMDSFIQTKELSLLPVIQGRLQSISAIIEEIHNVNRSPR
jgi:hypothetical protein